VFLFASLAKQIHDFFLHQKRRLTTLGTVQICNNAVKLPMLLSRGFWTDWAPPAYQQTSFALIGHSQRAELDSAANSTKKQKKNNGLDYVVQSLLEELLFTNMDKRFSRVWNHRVNYSVYENPSYDFVLTKLDQVLYGEGLLAQRSIPSWRTSCCPFSANAYSSYS
jgi:hypothetical protein